MGNVVKGLDEMTTVLDQVGLPGSDILTGLNPQHPAATVRWERVRRGAWTGTVASVRSPDCQRFLGAVLYMYPGRSSYFVTAYYADAGFIRGSEVCGVCPKDCALESLNGIFGVNGGEAVC